MKIKKGDNVIVIAGKDRGKTGKVEKVFTKTDMVLVEGVNVITKHQKNRRSGSQGQVVKKAAPVHVSNVALSEGGKPVRVGYKQEGEKKARVSRKSGKTI
ncbi:50S ribosomal protein L24 [Candidatus Kaiserbacteria bacterium RIFCSPHIGHO2_01_FULL_46_22]|uniref:Large ribosomal subunit protein uL24 n=1 Tax=Candidatus Kaiserbacteria bacterium RIFCSPHIGHO2_01_FULL_46_22 TaxID=1798475 RepID=A0A1F6BXF9_9BACT|nr:MAG: 50S ribosomal protein L24 [Candidatus Kaiserbacteria bacterium RIFCSPHIGHO2_01_FULL_46_22]